MSTCRLLYRHDGLQAATCLCLLQSGDVQSPSIGHWVAPPLSEPAGRVSAQHGAPSANQHSQPQRQSVPSASTDAAASSALCTPAPKPGAGPAREMMMGGPWTQKVKTLTRQEMELEQDLNLCGAVALPAKPSAPRPQAQPTMAASAAVSNSLQQQQTRSGTNTASQITGGANHALTATASAAAPAASAQQPQHLNGNAVSGMRGMVSNQIAAAKAKLRALQHDLDGSMPPGGGDTRRAAAAGKPAASKPSGRAAAAGAVAPVRRSVSAPRMPLESRFMPQLNGQLHGGTKPQVCSGIGGYVYRPEHNKGGAKRSILAPAAPAVQGPGQAGHMLVQRQRRNSTTALISPTKRQQLLSPMKTMR